MGLSQGFRNLRRAFCRRRHTIDRKREGAAAQEGLIMFDDVGESGQYMVSMAFGVQVNSRLSLLMRWHPVTEYHFYPSILQTTDYRLSNLIRSQEACRCSGRVIGRNKACATANRERGEDSAVDLFPLSSNRQQGCDVDTEKILTIDLPNSYLLFTRFYSHSNK
jgi:hypothetical protein